MLFGLIFSLLRRRPAAPTPKPPHERFSALIEDALAQWEIANRAKAGPWGIRSYRLQGRRYLLNAYVDWYYAKHRKAPGGWRRVTTEIVAAPTANGGWTAEFATVQRIEGVVGRINVGQAVLFFNPELHSPREGAGDAPVAPPRT